MDAHAHLLALGWAGPGHSLDSKPYKQKGLRGLAYDPAKVGNNGTGRVKPLSISQRQGRFGIGKKAHEPQAGNEWWLKGFESALGNIGKSESERSSGRSTPTSREYAGRHGGLYSFFVKGQQMEGTIDKVEIPARSSKKRKSNVLGEDATADDTTKILKVKKDKVTSEFEQAGVFFALRDKDEKRRCGTMRASPVAEFEQISEYLEVRTQQPKKKKRKSEKAEIGAGTPLLTDQARREKCERVETKEERRERRRRRIEEKEQKRQQVELKTELDAEDAAAKAARKAERKRRKAERVAGPSN
ncbi:hypothetical protein G647_06981 [Cladophialophora carrionii CBS 160.54]|uniref:G-patch domain-containing protein n=1 Tax=Cladophialophora carrionii CBS 160.54 TaxID=1279043 RepID=V9D127_9EURO|nr:uncharacterized protein G647_06981 [Cladophialophora carrionii CBS 160.54]ETI20639.1 hypothetical protein G647_06981 [Cladophialophora carrionii CBS 160.54]